MKLFDISLYFKFGRVCDDLCLAPLRSRHRHTTIYFCTILFIMILKIYTKVCERVNRSRGRLCIHFSLLGYLLFCHRLCGPRVEIIGVSFALVYSSVSFIFVKSKLSQMQILNS